MVYSSGSWPEDCRFESCPRLTQITWGSVTQLVYFYDWERVRRIYHLSVEVGFICDNFRHRLSYTTGLKVVYSRDLKGKVVYSFNRKKLSWQLHSLSFPTELLTRRKKEQAKQQTRRSGKRRARNNRQEGRKKRHWANSIFGCPPLSWGMREKTSNPLQFELPPEVITWFEPSSEDPNTCRKREVEVTQTPGPIGHRLWFKGKESIQKDIAGVFAAESLHKKDQT